MSTGFPCAASNSCVILASPSANAAATGAKRWTASRVDLAFGSNSQLRALAEVYASDEAGFVRAFVGRVNGLER